MKEELSDFFKFVMRNGGPIDYEEFCNTKEAKECALSKEEVEYYTSLHKEENDKNLAKLKNMK